MEYRQALSSIRREHDRDPFDAFHLQYKREQILLTRPLSKLAPVVWTEHGTLSSGWKGRLLRPVYRLAARRVSHLVTVSDEVAESVNAAGVTCAVSTIFTAVDERRFRPASGAQERSAARDRIGVQTSATLVSVISRLHPHKRIERAIDAIGASDRFRLLIAGTGPSEAALRAHAVDHPVDFLGWIDDPVDVHMACDIALLPLSPTEGLPTSLVEAAASGSVPVGFPGDLMSESVLAAGGVILEAGMTLDEVDWSDLASRQAAAVEWSADYRLDPWLRSHADVFDAAESRRPDRRT